MHGGVQGRVLREFSPEEVTANIYTMVDVLLHHFNLELQRGRSLQVCSLFPVIHFPIPWFYMLLLLVLAQVDAFMFSEFLSGQDLMLKACANLAFFIWTHELLPLDILLLALIDRDDDPHALRIVVCFLYIDFLIIYVFFLPIALILRCVESWSLG